MEDEKNQKKERNEDENKETISEKQVEIGTKQSVDDDKADPSLTKEKQTEEIEKKPEEERKKSEISFDEWYSTLGWTSNPFTFRITPRIYVGYKSQKQRILRTLKEKHKIIVIIGPTGSGKTTMLKWLSNNLPKNYETIYIGKPPSKPEEFVHIFSQNYRTSWILRPFITNIKSIYNIPSFLNKRLRNKHLVVFCDEAHESKQDVLEWLRVLGDNVENMSLVLAGLPVFDESLGSIETLRKRIAARVELLSLTKEETKKMIEERIRSKGGKGNEFDSVIDNIYNLTGGFPREILRICDTIIERAVSKGETTITPILLEEQKPKTPEPSLHILDSLTQTQREVMEMLTVPKTPGEIANQLDLSRYKSRQHAVRSMNNILKYLMKEGFVERTKRDRAFLYQLKPQFRSLVVKR